MSHSYDDISLFVPFIGIFIGFGCLFQRISPTYYGLYLPHLNKHRCRQTILASPFVINVTYKT